MQSPARFPPPSQVKFPGVWGSHFTPATHNEPVLSSGPRPLICAASTLDSSSGCRTSLETDQHRRAWGCVSLPATHHPVLLQTKNGHGQWLSEAGLAGPSVHTRGRGWGPSLSESNRQRLLTPHCPVFSSSQPVPQEILNVCQGKNHTAHTAQLANSGLWTNMPCPLVGK